MPRSGSARGNAVPAYRHLWVSAPWLALWAGLLLLTGLGVSRAAVASIERVSVDSNEQPATESSYLLEISDDGRFVAFDSFASNLVAGDDNGNRDVFVRDRQLGVTERISLFEDGTDGPSGSYDPAVSGDGRTIAFSSTDAFAPDSNLGHDIYAWDRETAKIERISRTSEGVAGNGFSFSPAVSRDGRLIAFGSGSNNLVPEDTNGSFDFFVHDRLTHTTERVSVSSAGKEGNASGNGGSADCAISGNGRYVAFQGYSSNLVPGDTNGSADIFVRDLQTDTTERVSLTDSGDQGSWDSSTPALSGDGRLVAFESIARNLVPDDNNFVPDVFVRDRQTGHTRRISVSSSGSEATGGSSNPTFSDDGRKVAFTSYADNLVTGDNNGTADIFVHDLETGTTQRVSVSEAGVQGNGFSGADGPASLTADGGLVAFQSYADNLVPDDNNDRPDVFVATYVAGTGNRAPASNAGPDQGVGIPHDGNPATSTASVTLDGRASSDPDDDTLSFQWRNAQNVVLGTTALLPVNLPAGIHVLTLRVSDPAGLFSEDQLTVTVETEPNQAPSADAGADKTGSTSEATAQVQLDGGSSADPDGDTLTYAWSEGTTPRATGASPTVALAPGLHVLTLTVTDPYGATDADQVQVTVQGQEPPGDFPLDIHAMSSTVIQLTWKDPSKKEKQFEVQRSEDGGVTWTKQATVKASAGIGRSVTWSDKRVVAAVRTPGLRAAAVEPRAYGYRVRAIIPRVEALVSRWRFCFVLAPPTDLQVEDWSRIAAGSDVPLLWQNRSFGDEGVEMEIGTPMPTGSRLTTYFHRVPGLSLVRANTPALTANTYHEIRIRLYSVACGESSWSEPIKFFTPPNVAARGLASIDITTLVYSGRRNEVVEPNDPMPTITNSGSSILQIWTNLPQPNTPFLGSITGYYLNRGRRHDQPSITIQPGTSYQLDWSSVPDFRIRSSASPGPVPGVWALYTSDPSNPVILINLQGTVVP